MSCNIIIELSRMAAGSRRGVAQVVECLLREQEAASSSLATPTNNISVAETVTHRGVAQVARVLA